MSNVAVIKFLSGQEIIAKVIADNEGQYQQGSALVVESPLTVQAMRAPGGDGIGIGLVPFSWAGANKQIVLNASHILCVMEPEQGLETQYLAAVAGIVTPESSKGPKLTLVE